MNYDGMRVDMREHAPVRAQVHAGLKALLVQGRQIWGAKRLTPTQIASLLTIYVGSFTASVIRDDELEMKADLGDFIFATIRWIDDLGFDPLECLDLAIEAQEKFAQSGRVR